MNRIKLSFLNGGYRTITFDSMIEHAPFTIFNAGDETVLTCVTRNLVFFEPAPIEPEKTSGQDARGNLFSGRARV